MSCRQGADQNAMDCYWAPIQSGPVGSQVRHPAIPLRVIRDEATACGKRGLSSEAWLAPKNLVENGGADVI